MAEENLNKLTAEDILELSEDEPSPSDNSESDNITAGEYDESSAPEGIEIQHIASSDYTIEIPNNLRNAIQNRLSLFIKLNKLNNERQNLLKNEDLSESVKSELTRQNFELRKLPTVEQAKTKKAALKSKLMKLVERIKLHDPEVKPIEPALESVYKMAFKQWQICIDRGSFDKQIIDATHTFYCEEPLYLIMKKAGIKADKMFSWAIYAIALDIIQIEQQKKHKELLNALKKHNDNTSGFLKKIKKISKEELEKKEKLEAQEVAHKTILMTINREIADIEPIMVKEFWHIYSEAAALFVEGELMPEEKINIKALLRYGLISRKPYFIFEQEKNYIIENCSKENKAWSNSMDKTHVLYADEVIELVANRKITPALDEDLELNHRLSPEWKADKQWRRYVYSQVKEKAYLELAQKLDEKATQDRKVQAESDRKKEKLIKSSPTYKKDIAKISELSQASRVEAARFERAIDRIEKEYIPKQQEARENSKKILFEIKVKISREDLARKEASAIHKVSRLCAKLKSPFPPFVLRDFFNLDTGAVNSRESIENQIHDIEKRDPLIFSEHLFAVKKLEKRIYMRFSPIIIISPVCGFMGYSWNPRAGAEVGRVVLPAYCPRPGLTARILSSMFADFRWDTSKSDAGVDLLTSDTLVAAYANVRWDYRKKGKHIREKAAIYSEENDRQNFRRHYELYLGSALDGGKRLFFKCHEVYDAMLKHMLLPKGVERLKK